MTVERVKDIMYPYFGAWNGVTYDEETATYIWCDELEYQIRDYPNGDFCSILVCFIDDETHSYLEFYYCDYENIYDLLEDVFADETMDRLNKMVEHRLFEINL